VHEYDLIADWYARDRTHLTGLPEVQTLAGSLLPGASVLDVGCGNGIPLTRFLVDAGFDVLGVDSSPRMLEKFRVNLPDTPAICEKIQACDLHGTLFDAAIAWGVIFHLTHEEQRQTFEKIAAALKPAGQFLFTSGDSDGEKEGEPMDGVPFHYYSFSIDGYRDVLREHGLTLIHTHADPGQNTYYLATRTL
jgi:2-polyprenyl-3-methyl-5-hydroxy-6-metoxy-1,4-benzoquinol methylase